MRILFYIGALLALTACQETIELDLADPERKLVVEALLRDVKEPISVSLTWTTPYYQKGAPPAVAGAVVTVTDGTNLWTLTDGDGDGKYTTPDSVILLTNRTYTLDVVVEGHTYRASSYMHPVTPISNLIYRYVSEDEATITRRKGYFVTLFSDEPDTLGNNYYWRVYLNDSLFDSPEDVLFSDDEFLNGNFIIWEIPLRMTHTGVVRVEQMSITKHNFDYLMNFSLLLQANGNPFANQPANPATNVVCTSDKDRYAFGYFGASAASIREIMLQ